MGLRGLKINDDVHDPAQASRKGNLANVVASMYLSSNLLRRKSETSSNKYEVLSKTSRRISIVNKPPLYVRYVDKLERLKRTSAIWRG
jgi:hypothetical protein